ncbi:MAG: YqgE/AlgH family protein [Alcaligenaceae bacterium]|nr:YqgE/AlgH family protein [Alcaligenaceae bacterium]
MAQDKENSFADEQEFNDFTSLKGHFLLAMPSVESGVFSGSVVYMFDHSPDGAAGVIINRPTDVELTELVDRFELEASDDLTAQWVFFGGPVQPMRAFVLHPQLAADDAAGEAVEVEVEQKQEVLELNDSRDILQDYLLGQGPEKAFICFGYAGWDGGQLEQELHQNVWLTIPADHELIFKHPVHDRYRAALAILGVEFSNLSSQIGHA